jgi:hypothetical protein
MGTDDGGAGDAEGGGTAVVDGGLDEPVGVDGEGHYL